MDKGRGRGGSGPLLPALDFSRRAVHDPPGITEVDPPAGPQGPSRTLHPRIARPAFSQVLPGAPAAAQVEKPRREPRRHLLENKRRAPAVTAND